MEELSKTIYSLPSAKAPCSDNIPPEHIKLGKSVLLRPLDELLCLYWDEGAGPRDIRDATFATLHKNKTERSDCNNYRGISLLNIVVCSTSSSIGSSYSRIVSNRKLIRLQNRQVDNRHDLLSPSAPREEQSAKSAALHNVHRSHQGLWSVQQEGPIWTS